MELDVFLYSGSSTSTVINVRGIGGTFNIDSVLGGITGSTYINIQSIGNKVDVWMITGTTIFNADGTPAMIADIQWTNISGVAIGYYDNYPYTDAYCQTNWSASSINNDFLRGLKRYGIVNTIREGYMSGSTAGLDFTWRLKMSNTQYTFSSSNAGGGARRHDYIAQTSTYITVPIFFNYIFQIEEDNDVLIGVTISGSSGNYVMSPYELNFSSGTYTSLSTHTMPTGYLSRSEIQKTDFNTIVWVTIHWDGSFLTNIYGHVYDLKSHAYTSSVIYTFSDPENYWNSGDIPNITWRCHPCTIENGETFVFIPTILTRDGETTSNPGEHGVFGIILSINFNGSETNYLEHKFTQEDTPTGGKRTQQLIFEGAVPNFEEEKIYIFHIGWDTGGVSAGVKKFKLSTLDADLNIVHIEEWEILTGNFPCVFLIGSRQVTYRVQRNGDVYIAGGTYVGTLDDLVLDDQSGDADNIGYNVDDVYEYLYYESNSNGWGYMDCNDGSLHYPFPTIPTFNFTGNRAIDESGNKIYYTRPEDFSTEQTDYINGLNT